MSDHLTPFLKLRPGFYKVSYQDRSWGLRIEASEDGRRRKLFAEELGGTDHISCNLYLLKNATPLLKPCEMPTQKVLDFIAGFRLKDTQPGI